MDSTRACSRGFNAAAIGSSLLLVIVLPLSAWIEPDGFARLISTDNSPEGAGLFEHLTVLVLIPGILCGLYAFYRYRDRLPHPVMGLWVLAWSLACIYFAGEEASWGQWLLGWATPDFLGRINKQGETNLHNMSPWLNQNPRAAVELFVLTAGFLVPLKRTLGNSRPVIRRHTLLAWGSWVFAPQSLLLAGLLVVMIRTAKWLPQPAFATISNNEVREFVIAWFLMWYLVSYLVRLKRISAEAKPPPD